MLAHQYALLDLCFLDVTLFSHGVDALAVLRRDHLIILHLLHLFLNLLVVSLLQFHDFTGALTSFLNLLPRFHLFLLEECDTVGEKLRIPLHTRQTQKHKSNCISLREKRPGTKEPLLKKGDGEGLGHDES